MKKNLIFLLVLFLSMQVLAQNNKPYPISDKINTESGDEYVPILTADGKTLYFCGSDRDDNLGGEDIYVSHLVNGKWTTPKIVEKLSTEDANESPLSVSADGNTLILFKNGEIYSTEKTADGWSELKKFDVLNFKDWNSDVCITADGNAILFSAGVKSWFDIDIKIYVTTKQEDGTWSEPHCLDSVINAGTINRSPFLHPDMKTLYFSTDGYGGYGYLDIYKTTRLDENSWDKWSTPVNLGENINTEGYDWAMRITTDGKKAIYNVAIDDQSDIYMVDLEEEMQAEKVITLSGKITDEAGNPLDAKVNWENLETSEKIGTLKSNPATGEYFITLPQGKNYGIYISKDGYYPISDNEDLRGEIKKYNIHKDFVLKNIKKILQGETSIQLNNVFFETNKYELQKESFPELNRLAEFLKTNPTVKIEISGHTDNVGSESYNKNLSQQRANTVKQYLISQGCNKNQLISVGYGESKPVETNATEEGRAKNRRVEFKVIK